MLRKIFKIAFFLAVIFFFLLSREFAKGLTDWWWYQEIGNAPFFIKSLELKLAFFFAAFLCTALPSFVTIFLARKFAPLRIRVLEGNILEFPDHLIRPYLFPLLYGIAFFISLFAALQATGSWALALPLLAKPSFGFADPIFHREIGFYVFYLPLYEYFYQMLMAGLFIATVFAVVSYGIQKVLKFGENGLRMAPVASGHLSFLLGLIALLKGFGYRLGMYGLLLSQQGAVFGIGYSDFHARLPLLKILAVMAFFTGLLLLLNTKLQNWKPVFFSGIIWGISSLFLVVYPYLIQQFQVVPSELDKERPFLAQNIAFTRKAYALEQAKATRIEPATNLTLEDARSHDATLQNIRLWDRDPLLRSLSQLQEIRPYYTFNNVDVDRYVIDGKLREIMLSARELDYGRLQNPTWANEHLIFTHGYGFVASPVNKITEEGLPNFFIKNIPPAGIPELRTDHPEIYYGESGNDYCVVNTKQEEFNYPSGDENRYTHYQGTGGVLLSSFWRRFVFAYRFSTEIFFSSDITPKSKILYYRSVATRLDKAFPLFLYDRDPYPVLDKGHLYWVCDAYTLNDHFPYAHPVLFHDDSYNYIRNSAKAVLDAYNGTVTYYISDPADPIVKMYAKIFPSLFHPLNEMPPGLKAHIRIPEDFFMVQAIVYSLYHMTNPDVFYNREDLWQLPHPGTDEEVHPYYVVMQLPKNPKPEFLLMLPFTPSKKDNLAAWMAARCDEPHYGEKLVFEFPKESLVFGPSQIQARINQEPKFSQLRTLWGQQGSRINLGHLQVIPVGNAILYVEPLYIKAERRDLPELKLVLLALGDKIVMEENLQKALASLFLPSASKLAQIPSANFSMKSKPKGVEDQSQISEALLHYNKALEYQKNADWADYGREIQALGEILRKLSVR